MTSGTSRVPLLTSEHRTLLFQNVLVSTILQPLDCPVAETVWGRGRGNQTCCSLCSRPEPHLILILNARG